MEDTGPATDGGGMTALQEQLAFRTIHLKEDVPFKYCVVLNNKFNHNVYSGAVDAQKAVVKAMVDAGLDVTVMKSTAKTQDAVILLVNAQRDRLVHEIQRIHAERQAFGNAGEMMEWQQKLEGTDATADEHIVADRPAWNRSDPVKGKMYDSDGFEPNKWESKRYATYAEEIMAVERILRASSKPAMESQGDNDHLFRGADLFNPVYKCVEEVFPLRDDKTSLEFLNLLYPRQSSKQLAPYIGKRGEGWFVEELRYHHGEQVAFNFDFENTYLSHLKFPAWFGLAMWIILRFFTNPVLYFRCLALYGFSVAVFWAPHFLRKWDQKETAWRYKWGMERTDDAMDPNPDFDWGKKTGKDAPSENTRLITNYVKQNEARQAFLRYVQISMDDDGVLQQSSVGIDEFKRMCNELPGLDKLRTDAEQSAAFATIDASGDGSIDVEEFIAWTQTEPQINFPLGEIPDNSKQNTILLVIQNYWELIFLVFFLLFFILGFMFWYINASLAPLCEEGDGKSWPTCFYSATPALGTDRWLYVFMQGLTLGIFLDTLLEGFVYWVVGRQAEKHNKPTMSAKDEFVVWHLFLYLYCGWFLWYGLLGMVYVPFGEAIQDLQELFLGPKYVNDWVPEVISMDTAMVTPLIVTQALNLLVGVVVPHFARKFGKEPLEDTGDLTLGEPIKDMADTSVVVEASNAGEGESDSLIKGGPPTKALVDAIKGDEELAAAVYWIASMPACDWGEGKDSYRLVRKWKTATHIQMEAKSDPYDFFKQLLRPSIQFSYIVNFSAIWPMAALTGLLNNLVQIVADATELVLYDRRPVPRVVSGMGAWRNVLQFSMAMGVLFTVGMITVASSGIEAWLAPEACGIGGDDWAMSPAVGCMGASGSYRLMTVLVMEHVGLFLCFTIWMSMGSSSKEQKNVMLVDTLKRKMAFDKFWATRTAQA